MADKPPTPIADDISLDKAWKVGRRIYVRCGYGSTLNVELREIGARWDGDVGALWVGTGKLDKVLPLVQAQVERIAAVAEVKAAGYWITVPYDSTTSRALAKSLGGMFDNERKQWAMPTPEALTEVTAEVAAYTAALTAARAAELTDRRAAEQRAAADRITDDQARQVLLIERSIRDVTDERGTVRGELHGRMRKAEAEQVKPQPGTVQSIKFGVRGLVLSCKVWFVSQDNIDDGIGASPSEDPGWRFAFTYAVVANTAAEDAADAAAAVADADHTEIAAVMDAASRTTRTRFDSFTAVDGPSITEEAAGGMTVHGGQITVTADGTVYYQHPGWYDDYVSSEAVITDPELLARIAAVIAGGDRRRGQYQVRGLAPQDASA